MKLLNKLLYKKVFGPPRLVMGTLCSYIEKTNKKTKQREKTIGVLVIHGSKNVIIKAKILPNDDIDWGKTRTKSLPIVVREYAYINRFMPKKSPKVRKLEIVQIEYTKILEERKVDFI